MNVQLTGQINVVKYLNQLLRNKKYLENSIKLDIKKQIKYFYDFKTLVLDLARQFDSYQVLDFYCLDLKNFESKFKVENKNGKNYIVVFLEGGGILKVNSQINSSENGVIYWTNANEFEFEGAGKHSYVLVIKYEEFNI